MRMLASTIEEKADSSIPSCIQAIKAIIIAAACSDVSSVKDLRRREHVAGGYHVEKRCGRIR